MAKDFAKRFYAASKWIKCRREYRKTVHQLCERCGELGDEVHHKTALTPDNIDDHNIAYGWDNLELLCFRCHQRETHGTEGALRDDVMFDDNGNLVRRESV